MTKQTMKPINVGTAAGTPNLYSVNANGGKKMTKIKFKRHVIFKRALS